MTKEMLERKILSVIVRTVEMDMRKNVYAWPPHCGSLIHQPKRPKSKEIKNIDTIF